MLKKAVCRLFGFLFLVVFTLAAGPADAKEKLSIWLGYGETLPVYEMVKGQFEQKYPDFEVEILTFSLRDFEAKLASSIPTGARCINCQAVCYNRWSLTTPTGRTCERCFPQQVTVGGVKAAYQ